MIKYRKERDTMGIVEVPCDALWGAQTQRSLNNFKIGEEKIPIEIIYAIAIVKKAAAITNRKLGVLDDNKSKLIVNVCDEIISGKHNSQFPLSVWQTGSGTQTNMNVNEVIANRCHVLVGGKIDDEKKYIHPNDDVNKGQSSNDVFPTAMNIATYFLLVEQLLPALLKFRDISRIKSEEFKDIIKIGRTHLMDAVPMTLGQEFSAFYQQIDYIIKDIKYSLDYLSELPIGGTAVGTGLNTVKGFDEEVIKEINEITKCNFKVAKNKFEGISTSDSINRVSSMLKKCAASLMKIANDIKLLASGPRCGLSEIILPENEPGSSIMPGKVNPTQCEAMTMVCAQIIGNDNAITIGCMSGQLQLNTYRPLIAFNIIKSIKLLTDVVNSFVNNCYIGIKANKDKINEYLENSTMIVTILNNCIGYDKAAMIVKKALEENISIKEATLKLNFMTEEDFDKIVDFKKMI